MEEVQPVGPDASSTVAGITNGLGTGKTDFADVSESVINQIFEKVNEHIRVSALSNV